jgi:predicted aspartyl protease
MISSVGPYGKNKKVILWVKIKGKDEKEHTTMAMIDCGATENFIDRQFVEQQQLPLTKKAVPRRVLAVDGRELVGGPVTHEAMVTLTINNHREEIRLHCITIGNSPIIVGLPWLRKHNPDINWREGRITFDLEKCGKTYLAALPHATTITEKRAEAEYKWSGGRSWEKDYAIDEEGEGFQIQEAWEEYVEDEQEVEQGGRGYDHTNQQGEVKHAGSTEDEDDPERPTLRQTPEAPNVPKETTSPQKILEIMSSETGGKLHSPTALTNHKKHTNQPEGVVPQEYHDYLLVFKEKEAVGLPPHRHHDHHIPLLEGKIPPFEPL